MSTRYANDLTVAELKERLRELGLSSSGTKSELIKRLDESVPSGVWTEEQPEDQATGNLEEAGNTGENERGTGNETSSGHHPRDPRVIEMELEILKREIEMLKTQSRASARVSDAHYASNTEIRSTQPRANMSAIAELLATFDGTTGNFDIWESQLRMLRRT
ncbi:uncharacterized protein LOC120357750 [Solenopsis invicta]|uniref:uncharacterized protein LOC120357750 n=1 Tax=Solenopsis invicta TaxID=13686 RepID=UPI00193EA079|nr:uncharacterized protein LOC120357750 [Solenopsis invicta]